MAAVVGARADRASPAGWLALYALSLGISLNVPRDQWTRICVSAVLNVSLWMAVMGYALVFLPASEAAVIAYTKPLWTALFAWPLLGERMTLSAGRSRCVMAFAGLCCCSAATRCRRAYAKLPGIVLALTGAIASRSARSS